MVRIWDPDTNGPLAKEKRPQGNTRVTLAFQLWGSDTVYRPWDRCTGPHNDNAARLPNSAWRIDRTLTFILEDLHGILNLTLVRSVIGPRPEIFCAADTWQAGMVELRRRAGGHRESGAFLSVRKGAHGRSTNSSTMTTSTRMR
jgi:hypothetical protein